MTTGSKPTQGESPQKAGADLSRLLTAMRNRLALMLTTLGPALGTIFLIPHPWIGALLWVALLQTPRYAAFALLGLATGEGIERILKLRTAGRPGGGVKANAVLTTIMVAWLTAASGIPLPMQLAIAAVSATGAAIFAAAIMRIFENTRIPSLVWAYCLVAAMLFSIFPDWAMLAVNAMPTWSPPSGVSGWLATFIRSLGALIYQPNIPAGLIVCTAILLWSRTMFFTGILGWLGGVGTALALQSMGLSYTWPPTAYNYFLAGMALGSVFFLPGRGSLLLAIAAGCGTSFLALVLQHLLEGSSTAYLPISAAITIWVGLAAFSYADNRGVLRRNNAPLVTPEEAWWQAAYWSKRFGNGEPLLAVPVAGTVRIAQGFNGQLSHTGLWRHALDFQRPQQEPVASAIPASIWETPVTAPAPGFVETVRDSVPDNALGVCNYAENWGNHVIIRLDQGGWALLAHLRQGTLAVSRGMRVETGSYIGQVGNSGRSPIPHLHLQVQTSAKPGAPTMPFRLANYQSAMDTGLALLHWTAAALPDEGAVVMAATVNPSAHNVLTSIAPGSAIWVVETEGRIPHAYRQPGSSTTFRIEITLDESGRHLFRSDADDALVIGLAPDAWRVLELRRTIPPFLKLLGLAAPSIPYAATTGMTWEDTAPIMPLGTAGLLRLALSPYLSHPFHMASCKCTAEPGVASHAIKVETSLASAQENLPFKLTCQFEMLRGPVALQAHFKGGALRYSLLSFEPGLPSGELAPR